MFKPAHALRPVLFSSCISLSTRPKSIPFPSLFELQAAITLHDEALKECRRSFSSKVYLPDPPFIDGATGIDAALGTIFNVELEMPNFENLNLPEISRGQISLAVNRLLEWINKSTMTLESTKILMAAKIPQDYLLKVIRALAFVYAAEPERFDHSHSLYARLSNCMGAVAVYRYFVNVMKPLGRGISKDVEKRSESVKDLAAAFNNLIKLFIAYMSSYIPSSYSVSLHCSLHYNADQFSERDLVVQEPVPQSLRY